MYPTWGKKEENLTQNNLLVEDMLEKTSESIMTTYTVSANIHLYIHWSIFHQQPFWTHDSELKMPLLPLEATLLKTLPWFQGLQEGEVSISLLINVSSIRAWEQFFATKRPGARTPVNAQPNANLFNPKHHR